jgi:DNA-directed RNA polymerase I subunit RPA2
MSRKGAPKYTLKPIPSFADKSFGDGIIDDATKARLEHSVAPHVDSFNYFLENGIDAIVHDMLPIDIALIDGTLDAKLGFSDVRPDCEIKMLFESITIAEPSKNEKNDLNNALFPREARESGISYTGSMHANIVIDVGDHSMTINTRMGEMPIMVMSEKCHLRGLPGKELLRANEEGTEVGGYFIMNGIERCVRLLQIPRRNHVMAIERNSYKNRGPSYSDKGVAMRCCRKDQSSVTITLHYLNNGGCTLKFVLRKQEFLLPVVLVAKALVDISDKELFDRIVQSDTDNTFLTTRLELLLRDFKSYGLYTKAQCQAYLGSLFRNQVGMTATQSDAAAGIRLINRYLFVNTEVLTDKAECLLHMMRKLFNFAEGRCCQDNADAVMNHELLLPGHLMTMYLKEKMEELLSNVTMQINKDYRFNKAKCLLDVKSAKYFEKQFERYGSSIGTKLGTFLSTGNVISSTGMDLMQVSGYTIVAERLNCLRYLSHFQSVHRGQFFTTMKTTTVRKLLPESWGFLCPVHTPDGSPCGLLNHVAKEAVVLCFPTNVQMPRTNKGVLQDRGNGASTSRGLIKALLCSLGMVPSGLGGGDGQAVLCGDFIPVLLDGIVLGGLPTDLAAGVVHQLRLLKTRKVSSVDKKSLLDPTMELAYFPRRATPGAYPGLYMHTEPGRMIRPVMQVSTGEVEWIGPMEQTFMEIACLSTDIRPDTTHIELSPSAMLSHIAAMTPYSDYNQSPRNMYQCQMGKQTMGTPVHAWKSRSDNKLYRIQNPQAAIVQTETHKDLCIDEYPQGTNAVVAVIAYTGYDMEDAMIINRSSYQRGFGHGSVYKTSSIKLDDEEKKVNKDGVRPSLRFSNVKQMPVEFDPASSDMVGEKYTEELDYDGLPFEGTYVQMGSPICCLVDSLTGEHRLIKHKDHEAAYVETVRILGAGVLDNAKAREKGSLRKVSITLRYPRNPVIGDKFSSRHGQKGTLSVLWPQENMPFSESGMSPDVLINPHAFPSRMTIGMLIESMAGKSGAMNGVFQDSSPFQFHEERKIVDHMGEQMRALGYHYYGSEPLYNGLTGNVMHADIFMGLVYYQRLRHMVSDKSQVRSTGPVMALTRQPVKGRKKHGGIRLGEMERDALISHGVSFCLQDRLMNCSDSHLAYVCSQCGSMLTVYAQAPVRSSFPMHQSGGHSAAYRSQFQQTCSTCQSQTAVQAIKLPYVFRYLTNELAGMGIKISLKMSD